MKLYTKRVRTSGLTLLELVVVVAILAFMAGLVTFNLSPNQLTFGGAGGNKTAGRIATEATLTRLKSAIYGTGESPGYWQDMNRDMWYFPRYLEWLSRPPNEAVSFSTVTSEELIYHNSMISYNAGRRVGWRGPYLQYQGELIPLDVGRGFTARLGGGAYRSPVDAWGNPVVLQWPSRWLLSSSPSGSFDIVDARGDASLAVYVASNARLVSAGPDGILQTELNIEIGPLQTYDDFQLNPTLAGDDIVLWLQH